jgi:hypothetical protein
MIGVWEGRSVEASGRARFYRFVTSEGLTGDNGGGILGVVDEGKRGRR